VEEAVRVRLCRLLRDDPVDDVRAEAARTLRVARDDGAEVVEPLVAALDDPSEVVRRAATLALGSMRDVRAAQALVETLRTRPELWQEASAALATAGQRELLGELLPLLDVERAEVRRGAARAIAAVSKAHSPARDDEPLFAYTDAEGHRHPLF
jgi:HEAT repeat protein